MKHIKKFEDITDEYPNMFSTKKEEIESVPGFESGTIDPEDDEVYNKIDPMFSNKSEKDRYEDFKKITTERNILETSDNITINLHKLYHDFLMSIFNPIKHYKKFVSDLILDKYICEGLTDFDNNNIEGIIIKVEFIFSGNQEMVGIKIDKFELYDTVCKSTIKIDKNLSIANKYNL